MKRLCLTALTLLCGTAYALPVGNPAEPALYTEGLVLGSSSEWGRYCFLDSFSVRVGYYGDFVYNRKLHINEAGESTSPTGPQHGIQETTLKTNAGYLAFNLWNRLDVFATFGATKLFLRTSGGSFTSNSVLETKLEWDSAFSWSVGARGILYQWKCFSWGLEGQYFRTKPKLRSQTIGFINGPEYFNGPSSTFKEWQVGTAVSYTINRCGTVAWAPYAGVKWSRGYLTSNDLTFVSPGFAGTQTFWDTRSKNIVGAAIGMSTIFYGVVGVNVEGRFGDEKALYVNGSVRF